MQVQATGSYFLYKKGADKKIKGADKKIKGVNKKIITVAAPVFDVKFFSLVGKIKCVAVVAEQKGTQKDCSAANRTLLNKVLVKKAFAKYFFSCNNVTTIAHYVEDMVETK
jgi:hypothetical protein